MHIRNINLRVVLLQLCKDTACDEYTKDYLLLRLENEGLGFLTITLPKLSKALLRSLEVGHFCRESITCFSWKGKSLRFFRSFLDRIFDSNGILLENADCYAIRDLRQLSEYFYKLAMPFTSDQLEKAEQKYVSTEESIKDFPLDSNWVTSMRKNLHTYYPAFANTHVSDVFANHRPRFGPGSFMGSEKHRTPYYAYKQLPSKEVGLCSSESSAYSGYFKSYPSSKEEVTIVDKENLCKVIFVPKDSRGPRVISKEPLHSLKANLAYFDWAAKTLERITDNRINFYDQTINRKLAKQASTDRRWSTLDLSEASDRVSLKLVQQLFCYTNAPRWFVNQTRSTHAELPSGRILRLSKLSGMGSGLTFPTMALLIHLSVCTYITNKTGRDYRDVMKLVYVYGDDVIVPRLWYNMAVSGITASGLIVGADKSFTQGFFRESCGGDYYKGVDVSPVRLRLAGSGLSSVDRSKNDLYLRLDKSSSLVELNAHTRQLADKLLISTKAYIDRYLAKVLGKENYPDVGDNSPVLGRYVKGLSWVSSHKYGYVVSSVKMAFGKHRCPYKYLGSFFKVNFEDGAPVQDFSTLARARRLTLKRKLVSFLDLVPPMIEE